MGPETPLRLAGPSDVLTVSGLIAEFRDFLEAQTPVNAEIEAVVSALIDDHQTEYLLIGQPEVGFAQVRFRLSVWNGTEDAWLEDVFVREAARGDGCGRMLVEAAVRRARTRGCSRIQLETNQNNRNAIALYEAVGFKACHLPEFWKGAPDICFTREI